MFGKFTQTVFVLCTIASWLGWDVIVAHCRFTQHLVIVHYLSSCLLYVSIDVNNNSEDDEGHFAEASSSGTSSSPEDNDAMFPHLHPPPSSIHYSSAARSHHSSTTKASKYKANTATSSIPATHESRSSRSTHKLSSLLYITTERLDAESRRATEAEMRLAEMVERLKQVIHDRDKAVADHIRVAEELRLHQAQLEFAQRASNVFCRFLFFHVN
jgi:hypothetical protein